MQKRRLVEINMFDKLFDLFINAKSKKREHEFIQKMKKNDPELGKLYSDWNVQRKFKITITKIKKK